MSAAGIELEGSYRNTKLASNVDWWYGGGDDAWPDLATALANIPSGKRPVLTFAAYTGNDALEYWWPQKTSLLNSDVRLKNADPANFYTKSELDKLILRKSEQVYADDLGVDGFVTIPGLIGKKLIEAKLGGQTSYTVQEDNTTNEIDKHVSFDTTTGVITFPTEVSPVYAFVWAYFTDI